MQRQHLLFVLLPAFVAADCRVEIVDHDGDGIPSGQDCDDEDPAVGSPHLWAADSDGDGYGDPDVTQVVCGQPAEHVTDYTDCDDQNAAVNPGNDEICSDGLDNDCDGTAAELGQGCLVFVRDGGVKLSGANTGDAAGSAVVGAGDVNGDGFDDILVGAPRSCVGGKESGAVFLVHGPLVGPESLAEPDARVVGEAEDYAGSALGTLGDVDGDGFDDLFIGMPRSQRAFHDAGAAVIVRGPLSGSVPVTEAWFTVLGEAIHDMAGSAVASAGDTNADGSADLLVGASRAHDATDQSVGAVYLVESPFRQTMSLAESSACLLGPVADGLAGSAVAAGDDLDGDGLPDILIGGPSCSLDGKGAGAAWVAFGPVEGLLALSDGALLLRSEGPDSATGASVSIPGDVDGDGLADVFVGAPTAGDGGKAYVILGFNFSSPRTASGAFDLDRSDVILTGEPSTHLGNSVAGVDSNADGVADLLVGAAGANAAYLFVGPIETGTYAWTAAGATLAGEVAGDHFGYAVAAAGDTDGDDVGDLIFGAPDQETDGTRAGAAYLVQGASF